MCVSVYIRVKVIEAVRRRVQVYGDSCPITGFPQRSQEKVDANDKKVTQTNSICLWDSYTIPNTKYANSSKPNCTQSNDKKKSNTNVNKN